MLPSLTLPMVALIRREFLVQLRSARASVYLMALMVFGLLIVAVRWPPQSMSWADISFSASNLFLYYIMLVMFGGCLIVPGLGAVTILKEHDERSWDQLSLTLISPVGILIAKCIGVAGFYLLLCAATAPLASTVFFLVGIDWTQTIKAFMILLASLVALVSTSVACSTFFRKMHWCFVVSYFCMACVIGLVPYGAIVVIEILDWNHPQWLVSIEAAIVFLPPIAATISLFDSFPMKYFLWAIIYQLAISLVALTFAWYQIRKRRGSLVVSHSKAIHDTAQLQERQRKFPFYLIDPLRAFKPISDQSNPVRVRELRWGIGVGGGTSIRYLLMILLLFLTISGIVATTNELSLQELMEFLPFFLMIYGGIICALIPPFLATTFSAERTAGRMDALHMTPLTPREIVAGKYQACLALVLALWGCSLVGHVPLLIFSSRWIVGIYTPRSYYTYLVLEMITILVGAILCLTLTLLVSVYARKSFTAIAMSYVAIVTSLFGPIALFLFLVDSINLRFDWQQILPQLILYCSPVTAYLAGFDGDYGLSKFVPRWIVSMAYCLGLSRLYYRLACKKFERRGMKDA